MLFDRYVVVDWSANSTPKRGLDSIWIAIHDGSSLSSVNPPTRSAAIEVLDALLHDPHGPRTLLGIDASLGYPDGTAAALGLAGVPWEATWRLIADHVLDDDRNANNRFVVAAEFNERIGSPPGPFWGCPPSAACTMLASTKPRGHRLPEWRLVEDRLRADGRRPHSSWQLLGAGSVGSQSLLAIAHLDRLRRRHPGRVHVWPLSTGVVAPDCGAGDLVVTEVWPSLVAAASAPGRVRDQAQVEDTASWLATLDHDGELGEWLGSDGCQLPDEVTAEEGWVLGVPVECVHDGADRSSVRV